MYVVTSGAYDYASRLTLFAFSPAWYVHHKYHNYVPATFLIGEFDEQFPEVDKVSLISGRSAQRCVPS